VSVSPWLADAVSARAARDAAAAAEAAAAARAVTLEATVQEFTVELAESQAALTQAQAENGMAENEKIAYIAASEASDVKADALSAAKDAELADARAGAYTRPLFGST
jgi:hypothetical protein